MIKLLLTHAESADKMVKGLKLLADNNFLDSEWASNICSADLYAYFLADSFILLKKVNLFSQYCHYIKQNLASTPQVSSILRCLLENFLVKPQLISELFTNNVFQNTFAVILKKLSEKKGLLTEANILNLIKNKPYFRSIAGAFLCLGNQLNQEAIDAVVADPKHALATAESLGAKPGRMIMDTFRFYSTAESFIHVRKAARTLAYLQKSKSFFKPLDEKNAEIFKEQYKRDINEVEAACLVKIASFCGDGLEDDVKETTAMEAYDSVRLC